ncbi:MAG TPA: phosphoribosylformylglycinamidine cyclo-ligase [Steroidobacteraceae bacterium]|nr:phosphoribosylformylglycinamidine cyclo-ligase [Steroidobacteraceae bacterium]
MTQGPSLTYRDAGVDIDAGEALVERIRPAVLRTRRPEVLAGVGGFGAMIELPQGRWKRPVLVAGTDGVGTKLRLAIETGLHDTVGQDLVAMCANDVVVQGAEPLFFLDYYATGRLSVPVAERVIAGIADGCVLAGCALVGGETAEMPGMYAEGDYDLAGFCVGVVEHERIIDGSRVRAGDAVIGLASSGPHSNGYSLIRRLIAETGADAATRVAGVGLLERLMVPTRIYVRSILALAQAVNVHAVAHITGGGLTDNIPRVLPAGCGVRLARSALLSDPVWQWIQSSGRIEDAEMHRTFNCGIGMVVLLPRAAADVALDTLRAAGERADVIGEVVAGEGVQIG